MSRSSTPRRSLAKKAEPARRGELSVGDGEKVLGGYLPMSYQIGGYALFLPERCLQQIDVRGGSHAAGR